MRNAILVSTLLLATPLAGDQLRIASSDDWRQWQLPGDAVEVARGTLKPSFVRRNINAVYNLTGHRVALISDAATTAGHQTYQWDGRDSQGRTVAPGIYILRVTAEGDALTRSENRLISVVY